MCDNLSTDFSQNLSSAQGVFFLVVCRPRCAQERKLRERLLVTVCQVYNIECCSYKTADAGVVDCLASIVGASSQACYNRVPRKLTLVNVLN